MILEHPDRGYTKKLLMMMEEDTDLFPEDVRYTYLGAQVFNKKGICCIAVADHNKIFLKEELNFDDLSDLYDISMYMNITAGLVYINTSWKDKIEQIPNIKMYEKSVHGNLIHKIERYMQNNAILFSEDTRWMYKYTKSSFRWYSETMLAVIASWHFYKPTIGIC